MITKYAYYEGRWGGTPQILLEELRQRNVFQDNFGGKSNANPYWYGAVLRYEALEQQLPFIKPSRRAEIIDAFKNDELSPIVRLLGLTLERMWKQMSTEFLQAYSEWLSKNRSVEFK